VPRERREGSTNPAGPARTAAVSLTTGAIAVAPFWTPALLGNHATVGVHTLPLLVAWEAATLSLAGAYAARRWSPRPGPAVLLAGAAAAAFHLFLLGSSLHGEATQGGGQGMSIQSALMLFLVFGMVLAGIPLAFAAVGALLAEEGRPPAWLLLAGSAFLVLVAASLLVPGRGMALLVGAVALAFACAMVAVSGARRRGPPA